MLLQAHAALLRVETARVLLAMGHDRASVAHLYGITPQAIHATINRFDLGHPLQPLSKETIQAAPYLRIAMRPEIKERLLQARIIETLLGKA